MAITLKSASTKGGALDSSNATTTPITLPVTPTTGSFLILSLAYSAGNVAVSSITGGGVTTWAKATSAVNSTAATAEIWYGKVDTTPSTSITVTWNAKLNSNKGWSYAEFAGVTAFDSAGTAATGSGTTFTTNSYTGSIADELLIYAWGNSSTATVSTGPTNSFTLADNSSSRAGLAYKIETSVVSDSSSTGMSSSRSWVALIAGFKGTSGTAYTQSLTASMSTFSAGIKRGRLLSAAPASWAASIAKKTAKLFTGS